MSSLQKTKFVFNSQFLFCVFIVLFTITAFGCKKEKKEIIDAVEDRSKTPRMHAEEVMTLVSDSGITRYRITAPVWNVYDRAVEPYWEFPEGIHFERFNVDLVVDANIHSNYAHFNENKQLWELRGDVRATNIEGSLFETKLLFWDQRTEKIYSDSLITITEPSGFVHVGHNGFESNQSLTKYTIKNTSGTFPVEE